MTVTEEAPLSPGGEARFRVMLRRTPPVWHEERIVEVAEDLAFENLRVRVIGVDGTSLKEARVYVAA